MHFLTPPTTFNCMQNFSGGLNYSFPALRNWHRESLLITISPNKFQMRVLTRTKMRYYSIVDTFYGSSQHQFFIFDFVFGARYPCYSDLLLTCVSETVCIKRNNNTKLFRMKDRRMRSWLVYDYNIT